MRNIGKGIARGLADPVAGAMARGSAWVVAGAVVARGCGLVAAVLVARLLGRDDFGGLGIIQSTVVMFQALAGFGLGLTAMKFVAEWRIAEPARAGAVIALTFLLALVTGLVFSIVLFASARMIAADILGHAELAHGVRIAALLLFLTAVNGAQTGALTGLESFRGQSIAGAMVGVIALPLQLGGAWRWGLEGALWGYAGAAACGLVANQMLLRHRCRELRVPVSLRGSRAEAGVLWRFSLPALLSDLLMAPVGWVCNSFLVAQPGGLGQMGLYNAAMQWQTAILFVPRYAGTVVVPFLSRLRRTPRSYSAGLRYGLLVNCGLASVLGIAVVIISPLLLGLYGPAFAGGERVLAAVALTAVFLSAGGFGKQVLVSQGRMWWRLTYSLVWAALALGLSGKWVPDHGAYGLALAMLVAAVALALLVFLALRRHSNPAGGDQAPGPDARRASAISRGALL